MKIFTILTLGVLLAVGVYVGLMQPQTAGISGGSEQSQGKALVGGDFSLTNQKGETVTNDDLMGKPRLVFFGFTHCPMICPMGLANIHAALSQVEGDKPHGVFITIDPERDTVEQLKDHLQSFPTIMGLTGSKEQLKQAEKAYRVYAQKMPVKEGEDAADYDMNHSSFIYLMDGKGEYVAHFPHTENPANLIAAIEKL